MTDVVAIVQARTGSQRFPGKVLADLAGRAVLDWVVGRLERAKEVDRMVVATSDSAADDALAAHVTDRGYRLWRGSLNDVLDRFHGAAQELGAAHVVRVTADCPLVDPQVVDRVVRVHLEGGHDFTANRLPPPHRRTYPIGLDVEVVTAVALERAWTEAVEPYQREHVLPYLYERPGRFDVHVVDSDVDAGDVRWTVDTVADLAAVEGLVGAAAATLETPWRDLLEVWRARPDLSAINAGVAQRTGTDADPRAGA